MTNPNDIINRHKPSPQSSQFPLQNPHMDMPQVLPAPPAASCLNDNSDTYQRCRSNEPLSSIHYGNTTWSCVICLMIFIPIVWFVWAKLWTKWSYKWKIHVVTVTLSINKETPYCLSPQMQQFLTPSLEVRTPSTATKASLEFKKSLQKAPGDSIRDLFDSMIIGRFFLNLWKRRVFPQHPKIAETSDFWQRNPTTTGQPGRVLWAP